MLCARTLQSFQFLVDVSEYQDFVHATHDEIAKSKDDLDFEAFTVIFNEYIKRDSNSKVNIDSSSKKKLGALSDRLAYVSLDLVSVKLWESRTVSL